MLGEYQSQHLSSQSIEILFPHGRRRTFSSRSYRPDGQLPPPIEATNNAPSRMLTARQWTTLFTFIVVNFSSAVCVSIQAPFFPAEAEKKGATPSQYGLVFGVFELTVFVVSPFYGNFLTQIGPKFLLLSGIFLMGGCSILFGMIDQVESHSSFLVFAFLIRIVEATGNAGYLTAGFSIIAKEFPDNVATAFGTLETFFGLGIIAGPTIGGALYEVGGYMLPFVSLGGFLLFASIVTFFILPNQDGEEEQQEPQEKGRSIISVLKIPSVAMAAFCLFVSACSLGFLSATLEPHVRQFKLTPFQIGLLFVVNGAVYAITTPVWGGLCDKFNIAKPLCVLGGIFGFIAYVFLGPAPYIPIQLQLWVVIMALVFHGLSTGGEIICGFIDALREAVRGGFPDNISTYGLVSSLYTSSFALGAFVGPSVGGYLFQEFGFRWASSFMLAAHGLLVIVFVIFIINQKLRKPKATAVCDRRKSTTFSCDASTTVSQSQRTYDNSFSTEERRPLIGDRTV